MQLGGVCAETRALVLSLLAKAERRAREHQTPAVLTARVAAMGTE